MGIFYTKLMESAVQDPDDIGIDLDAIEDNIMGDDGIEAHRDEVEAAEEGLIGDPVEEASMLIYESDYNFNQIMKVIGIAELNEAYAGRDFFLEGENQKGFFAKCREILANMFAKISRIFSTAIDSIKSAFDVHKKFVNKYEADIKAGFESGDWTVNGYDMKLLNGAKFKTYADNGMGEPKLMILARSDIRSVKSANMTSAPELACCEIENLIYNVVGKKFDSIRDMKAALQQDTFVQTSYGLNGDIKGDSNLYNTVINCLKSNSDIDDLKKKYADLKNQYKMYLKEIEDLENSIAAPENRADGNKSAVNTVVTKYMSAIRTERNIYHAVYAHVMQAYKVRRAQAYKFASRWAAVGKKKAKNNKPTVQHNSAFMNFDII